MAIDNDKRHPGGEILKYLITFERLRAEYLGLKTDDSNTLELTG